MGIFKVNMNPNYGWQILILGAIPFGIFASVAFFFLGNAFTTWRKTANGIRSLENPSETDSAIVTAVQGRYRIYYANAKTYTKSWAYLELKGEYTYESKKYYEYFPIAYLRKYLSVSEGSDKGQFEHVNGVAVMKTFGKISDWRIFPYYKLVVSNKEGLTNDNNVNAFLRDIDTTSALNIPQPILKIYFLKKDPNFTDVRTNALPVKKTLRNIFVLFPIWLILAYPFVFCLPFNGFRKNLLAAGFYFLLIYLTLPILNKTVDLVFNRSRSSVNGAMEYQFENGNLRPIMKVSDNVQ